jgi:hypothetical protein
MQTLFSATPHPPELLAAHCVGRSIGLLDQELGFMIAMISCILKNMEDFLVPAYGPSVVAF